MTLFLILPVFAVPIVHLIVQDILLLFAYLSSVAQLDESEQEPLLRTYTKKGRRCRVRQNYILYADMASRHACIFTFSRQAFNESFEFWN